MEIGGPVRLHTTGAIDSVPQGTELAVPEEVRDVEIDLVQDAANLFGTKFLCRHGAEIRKVHGGQGTEERTGMGSPSGGRRRLCNPQSVKGEEPELFGIGEGDKLGFLQMQSLAQSQDLIVEGSWAHQVLLDTPSDEKFAWA